MYHIPVRGLVLPTFWMPTSTPPCDSVFINIKLTGWQCAGLFEFVACPHYFFECVMWGGAVSM